MTESEAARRGREWAAREREVETLKDALGRGVDPEIKPVVVALRAHGLPTSSSCAGHLDRGSGFPYVNFHHVPMGPAFDPVIAVPSYVNHVIGCLDELLADFYRGRTAPGDERLSALTPTKRGLVLRSVGAMEARARDRAARKEFLRKSREEVILFAESLRERFLEEGPIMKRRRRVDALLLVTMTGVLRERDKRISTPFDGGRVNTKALAPRDIALGSEATCHLLRGS